MSLLFSTSAPRLKEWLAAGGNPNLEDLSGYSSIHTVAWLCRPDLLKILIEFGAVVNTRDINGVTPLMLAAEKGCTEVLVLLHEAEAVPDVTDHQGKTALSRAVEKQHGESSALLAELLYQKKSLRKEVGFSFGQGHEVAPFVSNRKNDPLIWLPVIDGVPDFHKMYLTVKNDLDSESLEGVDIAGDHWYIFIAGKEFIARRKE